MFTIQLLRHQWKEQGSWGLFIFGSESLTRWAVARSPTGNASDMTRNMPCHFQQIIAK